MAVISLEIEVDSKGAVTNIGNFNSEVTNIKESSKTATNSVVDFTKKTVSLATKIAITTSAISAAIIGIRGLRESYTKVRGTLDTTEKSIVKNTTAWTKFKNVTSKTFDDIKIKIRNFSKQLFSLRTLIGTIAGTAGVGLLARSFVLAASKMEDFRTRLLSLTKSSDIAEKKLKALSRFAGEAPFTLPNIIEAGITLEAFGAVAEDTIKPLGDLAAFMGEDIVTAASAFGRAFAAGSGAADVLRERGVLTLIKLQTGIEDLTKLTLPQFRKAMISAMTDPQGKIFGATKLLSTTFTGQVSMMTDAVFNLDTALGNVLLPTTKELLTGTITPLVKEMQGWVTQNKELLKQKFELFVKKIVNTIRSLFALISEGVKTTRKWWFENKQVLIVLGKLFIAYKLAGVAISIMLRAFLVTKVISFAKAIGLTTIAVKSGLTVAMWGLKAALVSVTTGLALFVGFKLGSILSDWASGLGNLRKEVEALNDAVSKNARVMAVQTIAFNFGFKSLKEFVNTIKRLGLRTIKDFTIAVKSGNIVFDKFLQIWIKAKKETKGLSEGLKFNTTLTTALITEIKRLSNAAERAGKTRLEVLEIERKALLNRLVKAKADTDVLAKVERDFATLKKVLIDEVTKKELDAEARITEIKKRNRESLLKQFENVGLTQAQIVDRDEQRAIQQAQKLGVGQTNITKKFAEERARIELDAAKQSAVNIASTADSLNELLVSQGKSKSKELFAIAKAANIVTAIMNTFEGATKALAQGGIFGPALAATVVAAGLANVAVISAQRLATGGITRGPTLAVIGDNPSGQELVLPVERGISPILRDTMRDLLKREANVGQGSAQPVVTIINVDDPQKIRAIAAREIARTGGSVVVNELSNRRNRAAIGQNNITGLL